MRPFAGRRRRCASAPCSGKCAAFARGDPNLPAPRAKAARPRPHGVAWLIGVAGVALVRREGKGLLGGMLGLPTSEWRDRPFADGEIEAAAPVVADWRDLGEIEHVFTHSSLTLRVFGTEALTPKARCSWMG